MRKLLVIIVGGILFAAILSGSITMLLIFAAGILMGGASLIVFCAMRAMYFTQPGNQRIFRCKR